jgi:hypothetical protein
MQEALATHKKRHYELRPYEPDVDASQRYPRCLGLTPCQPYCLDCSKACQRIDRGGYDDISSRDGFVAVPVWDEGSPGDEVRVVIEFVFHGKGQDIRQWFSNQIAKERAVRFRKRSRNVAKGKHRLELHSATKIKIGIGPEKVPTH